MVDKELSHVWNFHSQLRRKSPLHYYFKTSRMQILKERSHFCTSWETVSADDGFVRTLNHYRNYL